MRKYIALLCALVLLCTTSCTIQKTPKDKSPVIEAHPEWYYYTQLSKDEKIIYMELMRQARELLLNQDSSDVCLQFYELDLIDEYLSQERMWKVEMAFSMDHPEFYWAASYEDIRRDGPLTSIHYGTHRSVPGKTDLLFDTAENILKNIPHNYNQHDKVRYIYQYVLDKATYREDTDYGQDIRGVLLNGTGVCASYANTFKFLCDNAGIPCIIVHGYSHSEISDVLHMWNAVQINEQWYWVDATWGDTAIDSDKYLCMSDNVIASTHTLCYKACDPKLESPYTFLLPSCPESYK